MKKITLVNFRGERVDFEIKDNIEKIFVNVITADETVYIVYKDKENEKIDSNNYRINDYFDYYYIIEGSEIEEFSNVKGSSYERATYWCNKKNTSMIMTLY